jgi:hypothetical protein
MSKKRIFTDEELKVMGTPTLDLIKKAVMLVTKKRQRCLQSGCKRDRHLHVVIWFGSADSFPILQELGVDAVEEAEREAHGIEGRSVFKPSGKTDLRSRAEELASGLRGHMQPIVIKEDDERSPFQ